MGELIEVFGVGKIPCPAPDAPREQWFEYAIVYSMLLGSDRADTPVKVIARLYMARWHPDALTTGDDRP
jgi:hypothetical protein